METEKSERLAVIPYDAFSISWEKEGKFPDISKVIKMAGAYYLT